MIDGRNRSPRVIQEAHIGVDPQHTEDGVMNVTWTQRTFLWDFTEPIGGTDDLTSADSTSAHQD